MFNVVKISTMVINKCLIVTYIKSINCRASRQGDIIVIKYLNGTIMSEPHTNGTSVVFAKIYLEIQINCMSVMHSQNFMFKYRVITYKCFQMCVHHENHYKSSLLTHNADT